MIFFIENIGMGRGEIEDCKKLKRNGNLRIAANDNYNKSTNIY